MAHSVYGACAACGYESGEVWVGGGRHTFKTNEPFPAMCSHCHCVCDINLKVDVPVCSLCGSTQVSLYFPPPSDPGGRKGQEVARTFDHYITDQDYACPRCGRAALKFRDGRLAC